MVLVSAQPGPESPWGKTEGFPVTCPATDLCRPTTNAAVFAPRNSV